MEILYFPLFEVVNMMKLCKSVVRNRKIETEDKALNLPICLWSDPHHELWMKETERLRQQIQAAEKSSELSFRDEVMSLDRIL